MNPTQHTENSVITTLRAILGVIFMWLGLLKTAGYAPVISGINGSIPYFGLAGGGAILGMLEIAIGVLLLINIFWRLAEPLLIVYMIGVAVVFFVSPAAVFSPEFPVFSALGELLAKNIVLGIAGVVVMVHENRRLQKSSAQQ